ncbi:uncharacterized protein QC763_0115020 [Podospora pseudopauciseta]|uniref:Uncharacterized protein n=2 Tax=Podospora TaxID=5144 RepID=A0ABR0GZT4_9PEZI|nr:hypothetical protein QC763_0115020 [Podospora pseudopauciseta]KAK4667909.1 hypothetical protein QC764_0111000 [Podospora pseudoanserina]
MRVEIRSPVGPAANMTNSDSSPSQLHLIRTSVVSSSPLCAQCTTIRNTSRDPLRLAATARRIFACLEPSCGKRPLPGQGWP